VWTGFYFRIDLVDVQLEFLQSREVPNQLGSLTQSLAKFDIQCSEFSFESRSNQTKTINLVSQVVIGYDTRYEGVYLVVILKSHDYFLQVVMKAISQTYSVRCYGLDVIQRVNSILFKLRSMSISAPRR